MYAHSSTGVSEKFRKNTPCANSIRFLGLSRHFTTMTTAALLVDIVEVTSLLPHTTKLLKFSFQWHKFHICMSLGFCYVNIWNRYDHLCSSWKLRAPLQWRHVDGLVKNMARLPCLNWTVDRQRLVQGQFRGTAALLTVNRTQSRLHPSPILKNYRLKMNVNYIHPISLPDFRVVPFSDKFPNQNSVCIPYPTHRSLLDFATLAAVCDLHKSRSSSLCTFLKSSLTWSFYFKVSSFAIWCPTPVICYFLIYKCHIFVRWKWKHDNGANHLRSCSTKKPKLICDRTESLAFSALLLPQHYFLFTDVILFFK
jgi:hypothetical protein